MNILVLFVSSGMALILLIIHSYFLRGFRFTIDFFILSFLYISLQVLAIVAIFNVPGINNTLPLFVFNSKTTLLTVLTSILLIYLSLDLTERIAARISNFKNKIFPRVLLNYLIILAFAYPLQLFTVRNINWWNKLISCNLYLDILNDFAQYFSVFINIHFMLPLGIFYIIECSKYKNSIWKSIFIIFLFFQYRINYFLAKDFLFIYFEGIVLLAALTILAFLSPLSFECGYISPEQPSKPKRIISIAKDIPLLMFLFMFLILVWIDLVSLRKPILLISVIPVIFSVLLSVRRIPLCLIFSLSLFSLVLGKEKMIIPILPVIAVFGFWAVDKFKIASLHKKALLQPSKD